MVGVWCKRQIVTRWDLEGRRLSGSIVHRAVALLPGAQISQLAQILWPGARTCSHFTYKTCPTLIAVVQDVRR